MKGLAGCPDSRGARRPMFTPYPAGEHSVHREHAVEMLNWHGHRGWPAAVLSQELGWRRPALPVRSRVSAVTPLLPRKDLRKEPVAPYHQHSLRSSPRPTPSVKCSDLRGQAGCPVRCQREESASIFPGAGPRLPFWVRDIRSLWIHSSSKDIQAVVERVSYNAFL